jgi:hypothetical protein
MAVNGEPHRQTDALILSLMFHNVKLAFIPPSAACALCPARSWTMEGQG